MDNYMYFDLGRLIQPDLRPAAETLPVTFTELAELADLPLMADEPAPVGPKPPAVPDHAKSPDPVLRAPDRAKSPDPVLLVPRPVLPTPTPTPTPTLLAAALALEKAEKAEANRTRFEAIMRARPHTVAFKTPPASERSHEDSDHGDDDNDDAMFSPAGRVDGSVAVVGTEPSASVPLSATATKPPLPYITPRKIMLPYFVVCLFIFVILTIPLSRVKNKYAWTIWTTAFVAAFIDFFIYVNNNPCGHRLSEIPPSEGYECDGPYERNAKLSARVVYHIIWAVLLLVLLIVAIKLAMPIVWLVVLLAVVMCVGGSFVYHFVFFGRYSIDPHDAKHPVQYHKSGDVVASSAHCWYKSCDS